MTPPPAPAALRESAARLLAALAAHDDREYRLTVLKRFARRLGEDGYPLFLRILNVVAESEDAEAQRLVAETFATALRRMDLPGGALSSWGATRLPESKGPLAASAFSGGFFGAAPRRSLGPVEYLAVWHLQRTQRQELSADGLRTALGRLVGLLNRSDEVRVLYPQKLAADARDELEGGFTRVTRQRLAAIGAAWSAGATPAEVAAAALEERADPDARQWILRDL
ncbi:hypothetical protein [Coralloluteibacterium stylophorae]|uniref:Uncharacterized protein n=1 Tax=Coralloluteibacterium stylophorae TaxID=1776034 RepID=A0A8J7VT96_9GAMM|nr:hypothetical protein [Coralloluteibacterium stylophorae]MBS7458761.1 hypothetical protein [Coralloluteibacterium stylophorae]